MTQYDLIADVGGTNIRLALVDVKSGEITQIKTYLCAEFSGISDVIALYLESVGLRISHACIAIACPVEGDWIAMTNNHWAFSRQELQRDLGLEAVWVINDYMATAMSLPELSAEQKIQIGGNDAQVRAPMVVYGPGTGLGVAQLINHSGNYIPLSGEGGHVDFAPINQLQTLILGKLRERFEHVSVERLLSGPGLVNIYQSLCHLRGMRPQFESPANVTKYGLAKDCEVCYEAMQIFCQVMGSFGGNLALSSGAFGGVYIAGGIVTRFKEFFLNSDFRSCFEEKGRLRGFCEGIPVYLITAEQPGLMGAGAYLRQSLGYRLN